MFVSHAGQGYEYVVPTLCIKGICYPHHWIDVGVAGGPVQYMKDRLSYSSVVSQIPPSGR